MKSRVNNDNSFDDIKLNYFLLGLLISVYGFISLFNGLGGIFRFPFVFLFGFLGVFIFIIPILLYGILLCIRKRHIILKYDYRYTLFSILVIACLVLINSISQITNNNTFDLMTSLDEFFKINSNYLNDGLKLQNVFVCEGGFIGCLLTGLLNTFTKNSIVSLIIISVFILIIIFFIFLPLILKASKEVKVSSMRNEVKRNMNKNIKEKKTKKKKSHEKIQKVESKVTYRTEETILNENGNVLFNLAKLKRQSNNQNSDNSFVEQEMSSVVNDFSDTPVVKRTIVNSKSSFNDFFSIVDDDFGNQNKEVEKEETVIEENTNNVINESVYPSSFSAFEDVEEDKKEEDSDDFFEEEITNSSNVVEDDYSLKQVDNEEVESENVDNSLDAIKEEFYQRQTQKEVEFVSKRVVSTEKTYELPPLYILKDSIDNGANVKNEQIAYKKAEILSDKMSELNVDAKIENVVVGPTVTRYEITLAAGVRVNSFVNLQEDFKLALGVNSIRIEAPIPGKSAIGLEVPNEYKAMVSLKEIITTLPNKHNKLMVPIGKDIGGNPISLGICDMPHCLISGATNSGKSVCANAIIMSLLMNYRPDEVQMIMIDPKRVEMIAYTDIPHLLCPIIVDSNKAVVALDKLCNRMMERYTLFANEGVKNIATYNARMEETDGEKMPFILVFVDEFAELMLSKKANLVEEKIQKIVQLGRAAGIHLILATQRPDVNVITGTIKSNLPCRMTFRLSSLVDSRTVIDVSGAEKLLNNGDMLLLTPDYTGLRRVQGVFVSDEEIEKCVLHCKNQMSVNYDDYFMDLRTEEEKYDEYKQNNLVNNQTMTKEDNDDILYQQIKDYVLKERKASTSLFQRKFSLGASRAGRMLDRLEEDGIVGPENGTKAREVLVEDDSSIENDY